MRMADVSSTAKLEKEAAEILDRFLYDEPDGSFPARELAEVLKRLPDDKCLYERGIYAYSGEDGRKRP